MNVPDEASPAPSADGELSLESVRELLWKRHEASVEKGDPILMVWTMHEAARGDLRRLLEKYERRFDEKMSSGTARLLDGLKSDAVEEAVRERIATLDEARELSMRANARLRKTVWALGVLLVANWLAASVVLIGLAWLIFK